MEPPGDPGRRRDDPDPGGEDPGARDPGGEEPGARDPGGEDPGARDPGGEEPDYRFTLANERTFLAWQRTSLGLLAGGVALDEFARNALPSPVTVVVAVVAVLLAAFLSVLGLVRWRSAQAAMRYGRPMPLPRAIPLLATGLAVIGLVIAVGMVIG